VDTGGTPRPVDEAAVAGPTGLLPAALAGHPPDPVILGRERPHADARDRAHAHAHARERAQPLRDRHRS
jgi:hypothetical protein